MLSKNTFSISLCKIATFPAISVPAIATEWLPSLKNAVEEIVYVPLPQLALTDVATLSTIRFRRSPAEHVPEKVGVASDVMSSVLELPVSELAIRSGVLDIGAVVSTVTLMPGDNAPVLPAASVA